MHHGEFYRPPARVQHCALPAQQGRSHRNRQQAGQTPVRCHRGESLQGLVGNDAALLLDEFVEWLMEITFLRQSNPGMQIGSA